MDIISQLQEQVNSIAAITFNAFGTLQRDAPPVQLSPNYPEPTPPAAAPATTTTAATKMAFFYICSGEVILDLVIVLVKFDALVAVLPLSEGGEEAQLKRIAQLQVENDVFGQEHSKNNYRLQKELKQVQELFGQAADNCLNMKKPE
ncbi:hypothetical protein Bca101_019636 [Brassica carinata]